MKLELKETKIGIRKREWIWNGKNKCKKKIHVAKGLIGYVVKSNGKPFFNELRNNKSEKTWKN